MKILKLNAENHVLDVQQGHEADHDGRPDPAVRDSNRRTSDGSRQDVSLKLLQCCKLPSRGP